MSYTDPTTWVAGAPLPASDLNTYVRDNFRWMHDRGADLASAATVTPTTGFHKVTGTTTIDNIASPLNGHEVTLWFQSALTVRNQGGGTGNIRTAGGLDETVNAGEMRTFRSDGSVWKESGASFVSGVVLAGDTLLAVDTITFDFQNISGGRHLEMEVYGRTSEVANSSPLGCRFNNDSTALYAAQRLRGQGASPDSQFGSAATSIVWGEFPGANGTANHFGNGTLRVSHYGGTTSFKSAIGLSGALHLATAGQVRIDGGIWRSAAAITRVTIIATGGANFLAGSRATLYVR